MSLYVVDGHALCYRAYFAFINNPLKNERGQNTSAIFGFARMLLTLINEQKPDHLVVAFDPPKKSFRFEMYSEYKANRQKMPDDLRSQIEEIKEMLRRFNIPVIIHEGVEADDVMGTISRRFQKETDIVLVTGDKDAYQLVAEKVTIYAPTKGISEYQYYDREAVIAKMGLGPEKIIDYMAMVGDSADNIPGIKGIGPKTALNLLLQYDSLENILDNAGSIKGRTGELIASGRDMALLSKELVTIRCDVDIDFKLESALYNGIDADVAAQYFLDMGMDSIASSFSRKNDSQVIESKKKNVVIKKDYSIADTAKKVKEMISVINKAGSVTVDTETTSLKALEADLVGMSFSTAPGKAWYVPLVCNDLFSECADEDTPAELLRLLKPVLEDQSVKKTGQNIKYDCLVMYNAGINLQGIEYDTMLASYVIDPARRHNMDDLAADYLGYKTITYDELVGSGRKKIAITDVPLEKLAEYAAEDADITFRLREYLSGLLRSAGQEKLFQEVEMPLLYVLVEMEKAGVLIDKSHFKKLSVENSQRLKEVATSIFELAGSEFNLNSTRELGEILFEKLGLRKVKKTKTGYSTDITVLETLQNDHPIIPRIIEYRTLSKLQSTYIDVLPGLVNSRTGRLHTSFNQAIVATGRLSSSDPNLQNIPARDEFGKTIREGFIAPDGHVLLSADYSQIELRLAAHLSGDQAMQQAFREGRDIHNLTASSVFGVSENDVTPDMRRQAKIINFATIYGVSPFGLSQQAEIGVREAARFIEKYFETYPGFKQYIDRTVNFARENGYVETMLGRRRKVDDIDSTVSFRREGAERIAINTPIQGTSADMIKLAMISVQNELSERKLSARIILQVHDELVLEVPLPELEEVRTIVKTKMEQALPLSVPVLVETGTGHSWAEAH